MPTNPHAAARKDLLQRALRETKLGPRARDIFVSHPRTREVFERLAWYVTDKPLHPVGRPLLHVALQSAFVALERADQGTSTTREERLTALYAGLFRTLPSLNEVFVECRGERWDPLEGEPLGDWLMSRDPVTVRLGEPSDEFAVKTPADFRAAVAYHIFDASLLDDVGGRLDLVLDDPKH